MSGRSVRRNDDATGKRGSAEESHGGSSRSFPQQVEACLFILSYLIIVPYQISDPGIILSPVRTRITQVWSPVGKSEFQLTKKVLLRDRIDSDFYPA